MKSLTLKFIFLFFAFALITLLNFASSQLISTAQAATPGYVTQWDLSNTLVAHILDHYGNLANTSQIGKVINDAYINIGPSEWHVLTCIGNSDTVNIYDNSVLKTDSKGYVYPQPKCDKKNTTTTVNETWALTDYLQPHSEDWDTSYNNYSGPEYTKVQTDYVPVGFLQINDRDSNDSADFLVSIGNTVNNNEFNNFQSFLNIQSKDYNSPSTDKDHGSCQRLGVVTNSGSYGIQFDSNDYQYCKFDAGVLWQALAIPTQWTINGWKS